MRNFQELVAAVRHERSQAFRAAKKSYPFVTARGGAILATATADGSQCSPNIAAECPYWDGRKSTIVALVTEVLLRHPEVELVYIEGAYDGAASIHDEDYEPRVEEWSVDVWTRSGGYQW